MPPTALATSPRPSELVIHVAITPANAPASIMPSSPTANTPARSERMPPSAANSSGVPIRMHAARMSSITGATAPSHAPPGGAERDRREHEDHREPLDDRY